MKILFKIIVALLLVYIIVAFFAKADTKVERKIVIAASPEVLAPFLVDQKIFQTTWSPWAEKDKNMKVKFSGDPAQPGHKMEWISEVEAVGTGTMELMRLNADSIVYALSFEGMGSSPFYFIAKPVKEGLELTMGLSMHAPFILRPMMMLGDPEKEIAPDFEHGLANLKKVAELAQEETSLAYKVNEIEMPETNYAGTKFATVELNKVEEFCTKNFPALGKAMVEQSVKPTAAPMAFYKNFNEANGTMDVAVASRIANGIKLKGFESYVYPSCKALHIAYLGTYGNLITAHACMGKYMANHGYTEQIAIEEYVTDAAQEKDTAKWVTNIFYLLK